MPLEPGTTLGAYEILERIGEGGMGVVYRAKDGKLGRDVAVKLLSDAVAEDAERLARLQREARILASLNHPGIGAIYSLEESSGTHFLVLELVPGETLAERLARGPLPLREAISLFAQVAEAMETAHEHGILHRDLKPSNVKLTPDGKAKILDFGLAKELPASHPEDSISSSPTLTRHTEAGIVLGTAPYLSPEQARGKPLDKRTDVWAFGCCLYEALTGKAAFLGETLSDTIANVLQREPDWTRLPRSAPPAIARLLRRSLEKDPSERLRDLGDARLELKEASREPIAPAADEKRPWVPWALGVGAVVVLAAIFVPRFTIETEPGFRLTNIRRVTSFPGDETEPALSPDGEFVVFVSRRAGNRDLWLKNLSGGDPIQLTTHPADDFDPAWSPDGTTIAFRSARNRGGLYTQPAFGGDATRISDFGFRPRWSPDGKRILFQTRRAAFIPNELYLLDYPPRGEPQKLLSFERGKDPYLEADWAPDGNAVLYRSGSYVAGAGLGVLTPVPEGEERYLEWQGEKIAGQNAVFTADGRGVVLSAHVPLDEELRPTGPPSRLTTGQDNVPNLSKNGRRLAYNTSTSQSDIWKIPLDPGTGLAAGPAVRAIDHPAADGAPSPLPDNRHFLFTSNRDQTAGSTSRTWTVETYGWCPRATSVAAIPPPTAGGSRLSARAR